MDNNKSVVLDVLPMGDNRKNKTKTQSTPISRTLSPGIGIENFDVANLKGSQRLGIIGLPGAQPPFFLERHRIRVSEV